MKKIIATMIIIVLMTATVNAASIQINPIDSVLGDFFTFDLVVRDITGGDIPPPPPGGFEGHDLDWALFYLNDDRDYAFDITYNIKVELKHVIMFLQILTGVRASE